MRDCASPSPRPLTRSRESSCTGSSGRSTIGHSEHHRAIRSAGPTPLDILIRDAAGEIVGGLIASTYWGWLELDVLWVQEGLRRHGYGRTLLRMAEAEARTRGCSLRDADDLQLPGARVLRGEGYRVVGEMADYPPGAAYYWMRKDL